MAGRYNGLLTTRSSHSGAQILDMEFIVKDAAGSGQKVDDWQAVLPAASPLAADDEYRGVHVRRRQERASRQRDADG
jgi:hypothetical protein